MLHRHRGAGRACRIVAAVVLLLFGYSATDHASDRELKAKPSNLDRVLRKMAAPGDPSAQRVIIRTTAAGRGWWPPEAAR